MVKLKLPAHSVILNSHYSLYFLESARTREFIPTSNTPQQSVLKRKPNTAHKSCSSQQLCLQQVYADSAELKCFSTGAFCSDIKIKFSSIFTRLHTDISTVNSILLHISHHNPYTSHPTRYQGIPSDCFASICFGMWQTAPRAGQAAGPVSSSSKEKPAPIKQRRPRREQSLHMDHE